VKRISTKGGKIAGTEFLLRISFDDVGSEIDETGVKAWK